MTTSIPKNIYFPDNQHQCTISTKIAGYLNDTTWFANNLTDLSNNLAIADDFYRLANIKINKLKTKILTNIKSLLLLKTISLNFGQDLIDILITSKAQSERILGIYINMKNSKRFTINKLKCMIKFTTFNLNRKRITHDYVSYVINKVLLPQIEYLIQGIFLS